MGKEMTDISGLNFDTFTVISFNGRKGRKYYWNCLCICGNTFVSLGDRIKSGRTKSCGCINNGRSLLTKREYKHGMCDTPEYSAWESMIGRCYNSKQRMYKWYGAKGRTVCERWKQSFENFIADMGKKPSPKHSLDRFPDKNGNYEPQNCRWATRFEQDRNTTRNFWVEFNGDKLVITDLSKKIGISTDNIKRHIKKGKTVQEIINHFKNKK